MALTGNVSNQIAEDEHRKKNVGVKAVILHGYNSDTDTYIPIEVDSEGQQGVSLDLQVEDTGTYTYLGNAAPGTATSQANWRIKRVVNATGVITHADGSGEFNKEWDERASYTY